MALPVLIMDIGRDSVRGGVFSPKMEPLDFFTEPTGQSAPHADGVKTAASTLLEKVRRKYKGFEKVLLGLPSSELSVRVMALPFDERKKIKDVLPFELSGLLHVDTDELIMDGVPLGGGHVLAVAMEKKALKEYLAAFEGIGADPCWAGPALLAMPVMLSELYGGQGVKAFISRESFIVTEGGSMKFFKPVRRLDSVKLGLKYAEAEGMRIDEAFIAGWEPEELKPLMDGVGRVERLDLKGYPEEGALILALSLQLKKGFLPDNINLRINEFEYTKERSRQRRGLLLTAAFAGVVMLVLAGDLYVRYLGLSAELVSYSEALKSSYSRLFPGEKATGDEAYLLEAKLKAIGREEAVIGGGVSPLKVMEGFSKASSTEDKKVRLSEIAIAGGSVRAKGEADSFEGANRFKEALSKDAAFKEVTLSDVKSKTGGGAFFSVSAVLK